MRPLLRRMADVFGAAATRWSEVEGVRLGAAFSFYATFAIFPLLLLTVTAIGFVIGDQDPVRSTVLDAFAAPDTPVRHVLESTVAAMQASRSSRGASAVIGLLTLLFSASGAFVELDEAMNKIWGVHAPKSTGFWRSVRAYVRDRLAGFAIVGGIGLTCVASLAASAALGAVAAHAPMRLTPALLQAADACASVMVLSAMFSAAFRYVPRARPPLRDVVGGAILTTAALAILKTLFASYLAHVTGYSAYGIAGGVLAVAMWIYLSSQVIFFGACLTRAACMECGDGPLGRTARGEERSASHHVRLEAQREPHLARRHGDLGARGRELEPRRG
jgi:membrane protein